jgi:NHL repeat
MKGSIQLRAQAKRSSAANSDGSAIRGSAAGRRDDATRASSFNSDGTSAPSTLRTRFAQAALLALAVTALLALTAAPASALKRTYQTSHATSFTSPDPQTVAVDQLNGDIYAVDTATNRVARFDSNGAPRNFTAGPDTGTNTLTGFSLSSDPKNQVAVDRSGGPSDGNIYVVTSGEIAVFANSGAPLTTLTGSGNDNGDFGDACGVAVNQTNGDLYVGDYGNFTIWRYSPAAGTVAEGDYIGGLFPSVGPCQVAADSASVYAIDLDGGNLLKFSAADFTTPISFLDGAVFNASATAVAIDPSSGDVYVNKGNRVDVFASDRTPLYSFGTNDFGTNSVGVAVKSAGNAYVADRTNGEIDVYGPFSPSDILPVLTIRAARPVSYVKATLNGHLDTNGGPPVIDCHFEWGTTVAYGNIAPCAQGNSFSAPANVSADLTGLSTNTTYHFRLDVTTAAGDFTSSNQSFRTLAASPTPVVTAGPGTAPLSVDSATLGGIVNPNANALTDCRFEYVQDIPFQATGFTDLSSGGSIPCDQSPGSIPADYEDHQVTATASGLDPALIYRFRLVAANAGRAVVVTSTPGTASVNEVQRVTVTANSGQFRLTFGADTTADLAFNISASALRTALQALPSIGSGNANVSGGPGSTTGGTYTITFVGALQRTNVTQLVSANGTAPLRRSAASADAIVPGPPLVETTGSPVRTATTARLDSRVSTHNTATTRYHFDYVTDSEFQANGFANAQSTPDISLDTNEVQTFSINARAGQFRLTFGEETTADLPWNASAAQVQAALRALPSIGSPNVIVSITGQNFFGIDDFIGFDYRIRFTGSLAGTDVPQVTVSDGATPLNNNAPPFGASVTTVTPGGPTSDEVQRIRVNASAGSFRLAFDPDGAGPLEPEVTAVSFNSAGFFAIQTALQALPSIGSGNVIGSESFELPGGSASVSLFTFTGALANKDVAQLEIVDSTLTGSNNVATSTSTELTGVPSDSFSLVSAPIQGLDPGAAYRYRVVAESVDTGGPVEGDDMTLVTRASDAPLDHGDLPGPPGSDRAWEQVNAPDTGGNQVNGATAISDDGNRVVYQVMGGSPDADFGSFTNQLFAERTSTGWKTRRIYPGRDQASGNQWNSPAGRDDLSQLVAVNYNVGTLEDNTSWRISPDAPPEPVFAYPHDKWGDFTYVSDDASRVVSVFDGSLDPDHPVTAPHTGLASDPDVNLYDVTDGTPHLISLLPDGSVPSCGIWENMMPLAEDWRRAQHWVSADGDLAFFRTKGSAANCNTAPTHLYVGDIEAEETKLISIPPVSGPDCHAGFIRATADAAFFATSSALLAEDIASSDCNAGGDVYRYDLGDETLDCVTCVVPGLAVNTVTASASHADMDSNVAVSDDGSRVYFRSSRRLLPGADDGIYRVEVDSGDLAFVTRFGQANSEAITPDGSVLAFRSPAARLNAVNGTDNGGTNQYYRYDDSDRSLVCVSCPSGGGLPRGEVVSGFVHLQQLGPNIRPLSDDGDFAFETSTPLVPTDQNTAAPNQAAHVGSDIYEWRDGRLLLVTDGLTPALGRSSVPQVAGVSPSGQDIFFTQWAQLTPDAIDGFARLYTARVGGGFEFPPPPPPCPLEVCQGTPKGAPDDPTPASGAFSGSGNVSERAPRRACRKGKVRRRGRCVPRKRQRAQQRAANHNRRTAR